MTLAAIRARLDAVKITPTQPRCTSAGEPITYDDVRLLLDVAEAAKESQLVWNYEPLRAALARLEAE